MHDQLHNRRRRRVARARRGNSIHLPALSLWERTTAVEIVVSVIGFVTLEVVAASLYPGGTWWDPRSQGYSLWGNYLCDAMQRRAINGLPNRGAPLAALAMLLLVVGLAAMWASVPRLFVREGRGRLARVLGLTSAIATLALVVLPADRVGAWHGRAVVVAGLPGLSASAVTVDELIRFDAATSLAGWFGAAWLVAALFDFLPYSVHLARGTDGSAFFPTTQKLALAFLLLWMLAIARRLTRDGRARSASAEPRPSS